MKFLLKLYTRFRDDDVPALGAQISYYLILAFFPFLIFAITLVSYTPFTGMEVLNYLELLLPRDTYSLVQEVIAETSAARSGTLLSAGVLATLWAASNAVMALIRGLNKAYNLEETRPAWKLRALSLLVMFGLIIAILFSMILLVFGEIVGTFLFRLLGYYPLFVPAWSLVRYLVPLIVLLIVFVLLYVYTPKQKLRFGRALPGALLSTVGWIALSTGFSYYVNNFGNYSKTYGGLGGVIVLLIWLYWSSIIILLGGELNAALENEHSGR